jgi:hypothetical protein
VRTTRRGRRRADAGRSSAGCPPHPLWAWVRPESEASGTGTAPPGETPEQELRRLRRELATKRQDKPFVNPWPSTSRMRHVAVRRDRSSRGRVRRVPCATHVPSVGGVRVRRLRASPATRKQAGGDRRRLDGGRAARIRGKRGDVRRSARPKWEAGSAARSKARRRVATADLDHADPTRQTTHAAVQCA